MRGSIRVLGWVAVTAGITACGLATAEEDVSDVSVRLQEPPPARRGDVIDTLHGLEVSDPYRWLEDLESEDVRAWARRQDTYSRAIAARHPGRQALLGRVRSLVDARVHTAPVQSGMRYFYSRFNATGAQFQVTILMREGRDGTERVLVDRDEWEASTGRTPSRFFPSASGQLLAFGSTASGSVMETVRILDPSTGRLLPDSIVGLHFRLASITWDGRGRGFYYQSYEAEGTGPSARYLDPRLLYHRLGTPQSEDVVVYRAAAGENRFLSHTADPAGQYLVVTERVGSASENRVLAGPLDPSNLRLSPLIDDPVAAFTPAGEANGMLYFRTDHDAPNGRVIAMDPTGDGESVEIVAEAADPINTWSGRSGPLGARVVGGRLLVTYTIEGVPQPTVFELDGRRVGAWDLPYDGSLWSGVVGHNGTHEAFFVLSGLTDPGTTYGLDVSSIRAEVFTAPQMRELDGDVLTRRITVPASDGAPVPAYVVRRSDTPLDGSAPAVLYGYGFGGWPAAPYYFPLMAAFVERGGIWILAELRGDGGYGTPWHLAGRRETKARTFHDYVDVARWLVESDYTSADRLVANASSAGGPVAARALVEEPALFAAGILDYPLLDLLRYDRFGYGSRWVAEYGTASDPDDFRVLHPLSPYHRLDTPTCLPAIFVAPGENDALTPPLHAYKFVAAARSAQLCENPIRLRVSWGAGHGAGADPEATADNWADQFAFMEQVLPHGAFRF